MGQSGLLTRETLMAVTSTQSSRGRVYRTRHRGWLTGAQCPCQTPSSNLGRGSLAEETEQLRQKVACLLDAVGNEIWICEGVKSPENRPSAFTIADDLGPGRRHVGQRQLVDCIPNLLARCARGVVGDMGLPWPISEPTSPD
jgi:hypothetical protein